MPGTSRDAGEPSSPLHKPVLLREVVEFLDLKPGQTVVDGTVGAGGHSRKILEHIGAEGTLIGLDRDPMMLSIAATVVRGPNCFLRQASYAHLPTVLEELQISHVDRILLDLGLSSDQLADDRRGFRFEAEGPLDLRFDSSQGRPAWKLLEKLSEARLAEIFEKYGEERFSQIIARHLVSRRQKRPVRTAGDLVQAVAEAVPAKFQKSARKQPATRVFQALRIAVNQELEHLESALEDSLWGCLSTAGRAVIMTFHSLEDRLVKQAFRNKTRWQNLTPKPLQASPAEQRMNPRCRTAKLRAAIKR